MSNVAIVKKNSDFTEGKGAMITHMVFATESLAIEYVKSRYGIYGSKQYEKPSSISENTSHWNGYDITIMPVLTKVISEEDERREEARKSGLAKLTMAEREALGIEI